MNYNLTLKGHVKHLTSGQSHDLIRKGHVAYQLIRVIGLNYGVFIALAGLYKKLFPKNWW